MRFYDVPAEKAGLYLLPFALGNVLGPLVIGHLFDTIGRKPMITATYVISGLLLALTGWLFHAGLLTAQTQTIAWMVIFFIASAAASSAYLTVSEIFPLEIRAFAIAIFYAIGTLAGGVGAPILFGWMIGTGSRSTLLTGYLVGAALMIIGGLTEAWLGVRQSAVRWRVWPRRSPAAARELLNLGVFSEALVLTLINNTSANPSPTRLAISRRPVVTIGSNFRRVKAEATVTDLALTLFLRALQPSVNR